LINYILLFLVLIIFSFTPLLYHVFFLHIILTSINILLYSRDYITPTPNWPLFVSIITSILKAPIQASISPLPLLVNFTIIILTLFRGRPHMSYSRTLIINLPIISSIIESIINILRLLLKIFLLDFNTSLTLRIISNSRKNIIISNFDLFYSSS